MSFILDALKKLERTRTRPPLPTRDVPALDEVRSPRGTPPWLPWAAVGMLAFVAIGLGVWRFLEPPSAAKPVKRVPKEHKVAVAPPVPTAGPVEATATLPPAAAASPQATESVAGTESKAKPAVVPAPRVVLPATPGPNLAETAAPRAGAEARQRGATAESPPAVERSGIAPRPRSERMTQQAPEEVTRPREKVRHEEGDGREAAAAGSDAMPRREYAVEEEPVNAVNAADVPLLEQMSPEIQSAVPKLKISILAYAATAADRMAYINGHKYLEGQLIDGKVKVEAIARGGVVLNFQGQRFLIRP